MIVNFHGVRGSTPVSGPAFTIFGGHTSCVEIRTSQMQIILDAGSGFQNVMLCDDLPVVILFSHFHHDHIQGLAFNKGLFARRNDIFLASALCDAAHLRDMLQIYFSGSYFPIDFIEGANNLRFVEFSALADMVASAFSVETLSLNHFGGCVGYNIIMDDRKLCYLLDNEYEDAQQDSLAAFVQGANLVLWDGMFLAAELPNHRGWGHSSVEQGISFAENVDITRLAITHHAPFRTDNDLLALEALHGNERILIAREGASVTL